MRALSSGSILRLRRILRVFATDPKHTSKSSSMGTKAHARPLVPVILPGIVFAGVLGAAPGLIQAADPQQPAAKQPLTSGDFEDNPRGLQLWLSDYYLRHDHDQLPRYLQQMNANGMLALPASQAALSAFLARVFADDRKATRKLLRRFHSDHQATRTIIYALWLGGMAPEARAMARRNGWSAAASEELALPAPDLKQLKISSPALVDVFWAAWYGSGDPAFLQALFEASLQQAGSKQAATATQLAARWSLRSNVLQHQRVREFLQQQQSLDPENWPQAQLLLQQGYANYQRFESQVGNFSAALHLHHDPDYTSKWNHLPLLKLPHTSQQLELANGETLNVEVFATGPRLDKAQHGKLSYTLKISDAEQQTLAFALHQPVLNGLVASPLRVIRGHPWRYQPGAVRQPETLSVEVVVNDDNSGKSLTLHGKVKLLPAHTQNTRRQTTNTGANAAHPAPQPTIQTR